MADATVTVRLRGTFGYQGRYYGPGAAVDVPAGLASALGLQPIERAPRAVKASKAPAAQEGASAPAPKTKAPK